MVNTRLYIFCAFIGMLVLSIGCAATLTPTPLPPTAVPPTVAPTVTATAAAPTPQAAPTLAPALLDATLPNLAKHTFTAGEIKITQVLTVTDILTTSLVSYTSDGIQVTGLLNEPRGSGKFPAVVLLHGYVNPENYTRGLEAQGPAEELAKHGYITFVPDLRGYMESEHGANLFLSGWIADAINAGKALKKMPQVDAEHVGLWGHSMGGGVANRAMVVSDVFDAVMLYAPISASIDDMFMDPFGGEPQGLTQDLIQGVIAALDNPDFRRQISPLFYLNQTRAPVSIHVGATDKITPPQWARAIRDGLEEANKPVEYFEYPGQGHSFREAGLQEFYARALAFYDKHLR